MTNYRVRWGNVAVLGGRTPIQQRMCIAERQMRFLGLKWYWPIADWRFTEARCEDDIQHDLTLRAPLPRINHISA